MATKSLKASQNALSNTQRQLDILSNGLFQDGTLPTFEEKIKVHQLEDIRPKELQVLQINLGYMCNQVCAHCHVDAGPDRKEMMLDQTLKDCLSVMRNNSIETVDLTGGAPEMHPKFRWFVEQIRTQTTVKEIIVRSNLTIIMANKKYHDLPMFFAKHKVHVVSSLPFYKRNKTDRQRGSGVFDQSIKALLKLNEVGYGKAHSSLELDLVYNPSGAFLPGDQQALEKDFKKLTGGYPLPFGVDEKGKFELLDPQPLSYKARGSKEVGPISRLALEFTDAVFSNAEIFVTPSTKFATSSPNSFLTVS